MIFVDRSASSRPSELPVFGERLIQQLGEIYESGGTSQAQRRPDFRMSSSVSLAVRKSLEVLFQGRCSYCERPGTTVDHFRPMWRASRLDQTIDPEHYWWLAADWNNLYLSCHECNVRKANSFPIDGLPAGPRTYGPALRSEKPLLLDPCDDTPEQHLQFLMDGQVIPLSRRGQITIKILELNNTKLVKERELAIKRAQQTCTNLWRLSDPDARSAERFRLQARVALAQSNFQAAVRSAIESFISFNVDQGTEPLEPPPTFQEEVELPKPVWLDKVEIRNFKSIDALDLTFPELDAPEAHTVSDPMMEEERPELVGGVVGQPWLMILGENGVGKSSVLQAISLALMPNAKREAAGRPSSWLRQHEGHKVKSGHVRLTFSDESVRELGFQRGVAKYIVKGDVPTAMSVLAYGSTRLLPQRSSKPANPETVSVRNLFDHRHPLSSTDRFLCDKEGLSDKDFDILVGSLKSLLPIPEDAEIERKPNAVPTSLAVTLAGRTVSLSELSDGYKSVLALAMDIMFHLTNSSFDMESARGLVMIDELELHLHPRWKAVIVRRFRELFPNVRFVATTHDPLCVLGLRSKELHVLTADPVTRSVKRDVIDVPKGTRADEILTGPWFGVSSTIDADTQALMDEHSKLLARAQRGIDEEARRASLDEILRHRLRGFGATRAQRVAMAAAAVLNPGRPESHLDQVLQHRLAKLLEAKDDLPGGAVDA